MTIRLLSPISVAGVAKSIGDIITGDPAWEADQVNANNAVYTYRDLVQGEGLVDAKLLVKDGNVTGLLGPDGDKIRALYDAHTPVLLIGGDHPYLQWWGTNGGNGMAAWYRDNGIVPYLAINTASGSGSAPGGSDQMSWDQLKTLANAGLVEVVGHGERHYQDNTAPTAGILVTYTGAAATATFQVTGGNAVGVTAGGVGDFSFSLTGASYDTLAELAAAISAVSGWSCTISSELAGTEKSRNCQSGSARSAKSTTVDWPVAGAMRVKWEGTTYRNVGLQIDTSNLYVYGDGVRIAVIALSGAYSTIITSLNAITGITATLAGDSTSPNFVQGTETGTNINKWTGMKWLSVTPIALEAGLSSGYLRHRNNLVNKQTAAANGVTLKDFAQSGGYHYEQGASSSVWRMQRGNSVDYAYWMPSHQVVDFVPHISLRHADFDTPGKITAAIDALADSPGFTATLLMHKVLPDGTSGYFLPTNDLVYYDQTESDWNTVLAAIKTKLDSGQIRQAKFSDLAELPPQRPPTNWLFNPLFRNSGESLLAISGYLIPGWNINTASGYASVSVSNGVLSIAPSSSSDTNPIYQACQLPSGTWEFTADVEIDGYTTGNGVYLYTGRYKSRVMQRMESGSTLTGETFAVGNGTLRHVFEVEPNAPMLPEVRSLDGPFNLSTNTNIWLYINSKTAIDNINCAAGAASSSAVTAKEAAAAINAAIATAGWPPEYHTAARAEGSKLVITCPYITRDHTSYIEIRAASTASATATIFGGVAQYHYGKARLASGDWRSGSVVVGVGVALANGATVRISNPQLRRVTTAAR